MFQIFPHWQPPCRPIGDFSIASAVMSAIRSGCHFDTSNLLVSAAGPLILIEGTAGDDTCISTIKRIASEVIGHERLQMRVFLD